MRKSWIPVLFALILPLLTGCSNKHIGDKLIKQSKKKPNDISLRLRAGDALMLEERYKEAEEQYDAAVKLVGKDPKKNQKYYFTAWNNKGVALYKLTEQTGKKQFCEQAIPIFKKLLKIPAKKNDSLLHSNIAHCYFGTGNYAESEKWFRMAIQLNSSNENARNGYAVLLQEMQKQQDKEMKDLSQKADKLAADVEADPSNLDHRVALSDALVKLDRVEDAKPHFQYILDNADASDVKQAEALITANYFLGNYEQALTMLESQAGDKPDDSMIQARMGRCLSGLKRYDEARKAYQKALDLDASNPVAAEGLQELDQVEKAKPSGGKSSDTAPEAPAEKAPGKIQ